MAQGRYLVLLVDDNDDHCMLIEDMLISQTFARRVVRFSDAESALAYLHGPHSPQESESFRLPDFIFLDIKLPGMDGIELLQQLKANPTTRRIPTIILSTSTSKEKITTSYSSGACSYIVKPTNFSTFGEKLRALGQYWGFASEVPELAAEVPELASEVPELAARRDHA